MNYHSYTYDAVKLLKKLIAIPSISRDESLAADALQVYMQENGCNVERIGNNLLSRSEQFDNQKPCILLNAHIDTVKPVDSWTRNPFEPIQEDDIIYGLGANDCGGGLVALLQAFLKLRTTKPNILFIASAEEEVSGKNGIESVIPILPKVDFAIVGEPTSMQPAIAEKGLMVVDAVAEGLAGHAARNEGTNAIYIALDDINWIKNYHFPKVSQFLGPVKATVTIIGAGTQHNVIPDSCEFTIDVRINECYTNEEVFDILNKNTKSKMKPRSFRLGSSSIGIDHPFVKKCIDMGKTPFGSPTLSDQALMPFPSLKMGPGDSARSHTADEFIRISEIDDAINTYISLLK